jgi:hypothetical protein
MKQEFVICLVAFSLALPLRADNSLSRKERKEGFQLLFDGDSLSRWHSVKQRPTAGTWTGDDGVLTWKTGGMWLSTDDIYYDFILRLEYRTGPDSNSGIFLRALEDGNPAFNGMELQILSDHGKPASQHSTGSLYGASAPARNMALPDGKWNKVEISLIDRRLRATWNGDLVQDINLDDPQFAKAQEKPLAERSPFGHVGLQAYNTGTPVEFRNIRIRVLKYGPGFPNKPMPDDPEFTSPADDKKRKEQPKSDYRKP